MNVAFRSGLRLLLVVRRRETKLYDYLARRLAGIEDVSIIVERRGGDRRGERRSIGVERRNGDRRMRRGEVSAMGYTAFRFEKKPQSAAIRSD